MTNSTPLLDAAEAVRSGRVSSEQLVIEALERLEKTEGQVGAFLSVQGRAAVDAARRIDRKVRTLCCTDSRMVFAMIDGLRYPQENLKGNPVLVR